MPRANLERPVQTDLSVFGQAHNSSEWQDDDFATAARVRRRMECRSLGSVFQFDQDGKWNDR